MEKTNALKLRQNLGKIVNYILQTGKPVLVEKGRKPVAVLISIDDYQKRFVDYEADEKRKAVVAAIKNINIGLPCDKTSTDIVRELRS